MKQHYSECPYYNSIDNGRILKDHCIHPDNECRTEGNCYKTVYLCKSHIEFNKPRPIKLGPICPPPAAPDMVNHPSHYTHGKIEPIDVLEDWKLEFHEAIEKAVRYLQRKINKLKGKLK